MTERGTPKDLDKYRPDEATAEAVMNGPIEYNLEKVDPKLVARLRELNRLSSNPDLGRAAPPSDVVVYVPPTELPAVRALPAAEPKVELALPPLRSESPTLPSLKRLEGEPEVAGVVKGTSAATLDQAQASAAPRTEARGAALAVLAVLGLVVLVVVLMVGRSAGRSERDGATSPPTATEDAPARSVPPSAMGNAPTALSGGAAPPSPAAVAPTPTASPSLAPPGPTDAPARQVPTQTAPVPKHPPHRGAQDPYDASAPARPTPALATAPQVTAAPTAGTPPAPTAVTPPAPTVAPATTGPSAPAPKPEY